MGSPSACSAWGLEPPEPAPLPGEHADRLRDVLDDGEPLVGWDGLCVRTGRLAGWRGHQPDEVRDVLVQLAG